MQKFNELGNNLELQLIALSVCLCLSLSLSSNATLFCLSAYYLQQCPRDETSINACLRDSGNKLVHYLQKGIPELDIYEVSSDGNYPITVLAMNSFPFPLPQIEPVVIDEIGIVLGSGPDGYRALFRNIQAYGVSNITVTNVRYVFT